MEAVRRRLRRAGRGGNSDMRLVNASIVATATGSSAIITAQIISSAMMKSTSISFVRRLRTVAQQ